MISAQFSWLFQVFAQYFIAVQLSLYETGETSIKLGKLGLIKCLYTPIVWAKYQLQIQNILRKGQNLTQNLPDHPLVIALHC